MSRTHYCARCLTTFNDDPERCTNLSCGKKRPKDGWGVLLGPGDLLDRRYRIIRALAVGGAGLTYLAREVGDDGEALPPDLAIKVLYTQRDAGPFLRRLSNEAQILQDLDHENIVKCRGFVHRTGHAPYLVTQFENGGNLAEHVEKVGTLPPKVAAGVIRQILRALDVAHQRAVIHRDMKPENVLLAEPVARDEEPAVRLTDFGIAKVFGGVGDRLTKMGSFVGTPEFAAPEQFEGMAPTPATDLFAVGGVLYYLLVGSSPVRFTHRLDIDHSFHELLQQIPPKLPKEVGADWEVQILQAVLDNLMAPEAGDRWTVLQTLARLDHLIEGVEGVNLSTLELSEQGVGATLEITKARHASTPTPAARRAGGADTAAVPPPPPVASGAAPPPAPVAAAAQGAHEDPVAPRSRRGLLAALGGTVVLGGGALALLSLVGAGVGAWWLGWIPALGGAAPPPPAEVAEVVPVEAPPARLLGDPARAAELEALRQGIRAVSGQVAAQCGVRGFAALTAVVEPGGAVRAVAVDRGALPEDEARCVEAALRSKTLSRSGEDLVQVRASVSLRP
ncbi:MAG: serine/threonine protein kinase [Deltaproteobacteria bacterium]|nr:serine/threonine protein kinase [Deltaproteobacteria bacterium]